MSVITRPTSNCSSSSEMVPTRRVNSSVSEHIISAKVHTLFQTLQETSSNLSTCDILLEEYTNKILNSNITKSSQKPTRDSSTQTDFTHHDFPIYNNYVDKWATEHSIAHDSANLGELEIIPDLFAAQTVHTISSTTPSSLQLADSIDLLDLQDDNLVESPYVTLNRSVHERSDTEENTLSDNTSTPSSSYFVDFDKVVSCAKPSAVKSPCNFSNEKETDKKSTHSLGRHSGTPLSSHVSPLIGLNLGGDEGQSQTCNRLISSGSVRNVISSEAIHSSSIIQNQEQVDILANGMPIPQKVESDVLYERVTNEIRSAILDELKNLRVDVLAANTLERRTLESRLEEINGYFQRLDARVSASINKM